MIESGQKIHVRSEPESHLEDPRHFLNRELSLLEFQRRVLEEAQDISNPLLERVKFLSIVGSNLDEFFMVRVAGIKQQIAAGVPEMSPDGLTPSAQLTAVRAKAAQLIEEARRTLTQQILPALSDKGIDLRPYSELTDEQRQQCRTYFEEAVFPILTPLALDPGRPFPHISNLSLNLAVLIRGFDRDEHFARVKVPSTLSQLFRLDLRGIDGEEAEDERFAFVWLEDIIMANLGALFPGMKILEAYPFRLTRNADLVIQELEADDLLETIEASVRRRRFGTVVRLTVNTAMPDHVLEILTSNLDVNQKDLYRVDGPLGLNRLMSLYHLDRADLKDSAFLPAVPPALDARLEEKDLFSSLSREPILLHHPFDSFMPVADFFREAARDPDVLAIKCTLYRVGRNSPVVEALLKAMENGKQVAVLVELKARFDEESNIHWAKSLEREGVHVVYGLLGLKTHCKVAMVLRREGSGIRRYVHLATGNYNALTAQAYTDLGYFTCDDDIGADATDLFNYLTGYSAKTNYRKLLVAPINMRQRLQQWVDNTIQRHQAGAPGHIVFKMNSLVDKPFIQLLYRASQAGVKVDLLVRGICCLRPGVPGLSDNIRVTSIVGRFLEHSRIFYIRSGSDEQVYLGSADLMPRNLNHRVEVLFPIESVQWIRYIRDELLETYLSDSIKAREMMSDGSYRRKKPGSETPPINSQDWLLKHRMDRFESASH